MASLGHVLGDVEKAKLVIYTDSTATVNPIQSAASALANGLAAPDVGPGKHVLTVQYNPASLTIQANAESVRYSSLQKGVDPSIINQNLRPPNVTLGVELIFDAVNNRDAFMNETLHLSAASIVDAAENIKLLKRGGHHTVQPETNAILSLALRPNTKYVSFCWSKMVFTGLVSEVRAEYTMFSTSGRPIRSKVMMNICQDVSSPAQEASWDEALNAQLKGKSSLARYNNLLNSTNFV